MAVSYDWYVYQQNKLYPKRWAKATDEPIREHQADDIITKAVERSGVKPGTLRKKSFVTGSKPPNEIIED